MTIQIEDRDILSDPTERLAYTIVQASRALGVSDTKIRALMQTGDLPYVKLSRRTLIRKIDLEAFLEKRLRIGA